MRRFIARLDSPLRRAGAVLAAVGTALLLVGMFVLIEDYGLDDNVIEYAWHAITGHRRFGRDYWMVAWGAYLLAIGALLVSPYPTRLLSWVRNGNPPRDP